MIEYKRCYYPDKTLKQETSYLNGKKHGFERHYYTNKQIYREILWEHDQKDLRRFWYITGQLWSETPYINNKKHGIEKVWYKNGQLWVQTTWDNGEIHTIEKVWHIDGRLRKEKYFTYGNLHYQHSYYDDMRHGKSRRYTITGLFIEEYFIYHNQVSKEEYEKYLLIEQLSGLCNDFSF